MSTAHVTLRAGGAGSVTIADTTYALRTTNLDDARRQARDIVAARATEIGNALTMHATEPDGRSFTVLVHPDGTISSPEPARVSPPQQATVTGPPDLEQAMSTLDTPSTPHAPDSPPAPTPAAPATPSRRELREQARSTTLLTDHASEPPATTGWRGALNAIGMHLAPSSAERAHRADVAAVSQHWPGPRTIAVVNGKGGAGKTPAAILLSAVFARHGGAGVVAFDNNPTRGTLGWRTLQGPHDASVADLLPAADALLSPQAQAAQMAAYVHHQPADRYDVLRSRPEVLADAQPTTAQSVNAVHAVLSKYYRLVIVDSGNDESSEQWRAMIRQADAIVVPTITRPEHAESARLLLVELAGADEHSAHLADEALVIVSQASKAEPAPDELVSIFNNIAHAAVGIPYDPAMAGRPLALDSLAPATRRAWLAAAAAAATAL